MITVVRLNLSLKWKLYSLNEQNLGTKVRMTTKSIVYYFRKINLFTNNFLLSYLENIISTIKLYKRRDYVRLFSVGLMNSLFPLAL